MTTLDNQDQGSLPSLKPTRLFPKNPLGQLRTDAGFPNGAQTARKLRISAAHLYGIEGGQKRPSEDLMKRMAALYGYEVPVVRHLVHQTHLKWLERIGEAFRKGGDVSG